MPRLKTVPVHCVVAHVPIVFWVSSTTMELFNAFHLNETLWMLCYYALLAGNCSAAFAVIFGMMDLEKLQVKEAIEDGEQHVTFVLISFLLYGATLWIKIQSLGTVTQTRSELLFSLMGLITLIIGSYYGLRLVYVHKVGVDAD